MDAELKALNEATVAAAAQGLQVILLDQIDGVWTAIASDKMDGEPLATGTGVDRTAALLSLVAHLEAR